MRVRDFEFNLRELAGSMGDFGTFFPLAIGFVAAVGLYHILRKWGRSNSYINWMVGSEEK